MPLVVEGREAHARKAPRRQVHVHHDGDDRRGTEHAAHHERALRRLGLQAHRLLQSVFEDARHILLRHGLARHAAHRHAARRRLGEGVPRAEAVRGALLRRLPQPVDRGGPAAYSRRRGRYVADPARVSDERRGGPAHAGGARGIAALFIGSAAAAPAGDEAPQGGPDGAHAQAAGRPAGERTEGVGAALLRLPARARGEDHLVIDVAQELHRRVGHDHVRGLEEEVVLDAADAVRGLAAREGVGHNGREGRHERNHVVRLDETVEVLLDRRVATELVEALCLEVLLGDAAKGLKVPLLGAAGREQTRADLLPQAFESHELRIGQIAHHRALAALRKRPRELHGEQRHGVATHHVHGHAVLEAEGVHDGSTFHVKAIVHGGIWDPVRDGLVRRRRLRRSGAIAAFVSILLLHHGCGLLLEASLDGDELRLLPDEVGVLDHQVREVPEAGDAHKVEALGRCVAEHAQQEGRPLAKIVLLHLLVALHVVFVGLRGVGLTL
mmetsp:Transcript_9665/g.28269  ORF Transcript_9665/g.28269 Transcript_9665/m.28269 type:complete len:498 (-) Transcript_9665:316-1809(-)